VRWSVLECVGVCCSMCEREILGRVVNMLLCAAACCSVLQRV